MPSVATKFLLKLSILIFSRLFHFRLEIPFLGKFGPKTQNRFFKVKFETQSDSNMQNLMVVFILAVLDKKIKIVSWSWNLLSRLIGVYHSMVIFIVFLLDQKYSFWMNLVQKFIIFSLNLIPSLIRICTMVMVTFSVLDLFFGSFVQKHHLAFWCYLINLPAVYSQKLEVSGCSCLKGKNGGISQVIVLSRNQKMLLMGSTSIDFTETINEIV